MVKECIFEIKQKGRFPQRLFCLHDKVKRYKLNAEETDDRKFTFSVEQCQECWQTELLILVEH